MNGDVFLCVLGILFLGVAMGWGASWFLERIFNDDL